MEPQIQAIDLELDQLEANLARIEQALGEEVARPFRLLLNWHLDLVRLIEQKDITLLRLRRLLFGATTERTRNIVDEQASEGKPLEPERKDTPPGAEPASCQATSDGSAPPEPPPSGAPGRRRPPRHGHGRTPADAYTGCPRVMITHPTHHPGDPCPHCQDSTLYRQADWSPVVRLKGQPPVAGVRYELERLRCGLCGKVHTAPLPDEAGPSKYDPSVASIIATLRYGHGMPFHRIEQMQRAAGIPLPSSVQWQLVHDALERGIVVVWNYLLTLAAQGELFYNDDTHMRVQELSLKKRRGEPLREDAPDCKGCIPVLQQLFSRFWRLLRFLRWRIQF